MYGETIILRINSAVYLGENMDDCLVNPIQCMEAGTSMDLRLKKFYPNDDNAQKIISSMKLKPPILHDGPLPFIHIRRPTAKELDNCQHVDMTEHGTTWDPHSPIHTINNIESSFTDDVLQYSD